MRVSLRLQIALILLALTALTAVLVGIPVLNLLERALAEGVPQAVAEQLSRARFLISLYALLAAVIVVLVGFVLLSRLVVRPIRRIRVATERVASGDRARRLDIQSGNEIGDLAASFNHMLDGLEEGRRALEKQVETLEETQRDLERAHRAVIRGEKLASVGRLAAGVAHEVGNPLAAVLGLVEVMRDEPSLAPAERADLLDRVERELLRIHETIRDLLDYSRSSSEEITAVSVAGVAQQARKLVEAQPRFKRIELDLTSEKKVPLARADADRLLQVMVNLLLNAADAIQGQGRVSVTLKGERDGVSVAVTDSGPGIPSEVIGHIFEPFFTTKPPGQGTGLGLAICESIVEGLGGELFVDGGGEGRGATFTIWLAASGEAAESEATGPSGG